MSVDQWKYKMNCVRTWRINTCTTVCPPGQFGLAKLYPIHAYCVIEDMILVNRSGITTWNVNTKLDKILLHFLAKKDTPFKMLFWTALRCLLKDSIEYRFLVWHYKGKCLCKIYSIYQYASTILALSRHMLCEHQTSVTVTYTLNLCYFAKEKYLQMLLTCYQQFILIILFLVMTIIRTKTSIQLIYPINVQVTLYTGHW